MWQFDSGRMAADSFNPLSDAGLTLLVDRTSTFFQNNTFTTQSTADNDPVYRWTGLVGSRHLDALAGVPYPTFAASDPSANNPSVIFNGSTTLPLFNTDGAGIVSGSAASMIVTVKNAGASGRSAICGRGGFLAEGFTLHFDASNQLVGIVRAASGTSTLTGPVVSAGSWACVLLTYDGTTARMVVRGDATNYSEARTGALTFSDNSFAVGGTGASGGFAFNNNGGKRVALVACTTTTYDATTGAAILNQYATYAGVP